MFSRTFSSSSRGRLRNRDAGVFSRRYLDVYLLKGEIRCRRSNIDEGSVHCGRYICHPRGRIGRSSLGFHIQAASER